MNNKTEGTQVKKTENQIDDSDMTSHFENL